jgi:anti-anti-sigma factor
MGPATDSPRPGPLVSRPTVDYVQVMGDVDLADSVELDLAARALIEADASVVYVDLGVVTFMGSTLVAFLVQLAHAERRTHRPLVLCRPTPMARKVIHMTGLDQLAIGRPDLPPLWPDVIPN